MGSLFTALFFESLFPEFFATSTEARGENLRREKKTTILLVEQNARVALKMADRGYVLETGKVILEGIASDLLENKEVQRAYLGKEKKEMWER